MSLLPDISNHINKLYDHKATVGRKVKYKSNTGATKFTTQEIYKDIPCRLYISSRTESKQGEVNEVKYINKIILDTKYEILTGDKITINQYGNILEDFFAGQPVKYKSSIQIPVERRAKA